MGNNTSKLRNASGENVPPAPTPPALLAGDGNGDIFAAAPPAPTPPAPTLPTPPPSHPAQVPTAEDVSLPAASSSRPARSTMPSMPSQQIFQRETSLERDLVLIAQYESTMSSMPSQETSQRGTSLERDLWLVDESEYTMPSTPSRSNFPPHRTPRAPGYYEGSPRTSGLFASGPSSVSRPASRPSPYVDGPGVGWTRQVLEASSPSRTPLERQLRLLRTPQAPGHYEDSRRISRRSDPSVGGHSADTAGASSLPGESLLVRPESLNTLYLSIDGVGVVGHIRKVSAPAASAQSSWPREPSTTNNQPVSPGLTSTPALNPLASTSSDGSVHSTHLQPLDRFSSMLSDITDEDARPPVLPGLPRTMPTKPTTSAGQVSHLPARTMSSEVNYPREQAHLESFAPTHRPATTGAHTMHSSPSQVPSSWSMGPPIPPNLPAFSSSPTVFRQLMADEAPASTLQGARRVDFSSSPPSASATMMTPGRQHKDGPESGPSSNFYPSTPASSDPDNPSRDQLGLQSPTPPRRGQPLPSWTRGDGRRAFGTGEQAAPPSYDAAMASLADPRPADTRPSEGGASSNAGSSGTPRLDRRGNPPRRSRGYGLSRGRMSYQQAADQLRRQTERNWSPSREQDEGEKEESDEETGRVKRPRHS